MTFSWRWLASSGLDDVFVAHYAKLVARAHQLVGHDRAAAEALVHETYVRVALRHPDLASIEKPDAYFYVTMRNVHLSEVRRRGSGSAAGISLVDYESIEASLATVPAQRQRQAAYDELVLVARYACARKDASKAASTLILRFFHGYHPGEIARLLHTTERAVDTRLRIARAEARAYLADPASHRRSGASGRGVRRFEWVPDERSFVVSLRQAVFDAKQGECPSPADLERLYADAADPIATATLAHIVSCPDCLDGLNRRFGFRLLKDRDPIDMSGRGERSGGTRGET